MNRVLLAVLACAWAPFLFACGDDDDDGAEAEAESEAEAEAESEAEAEAESESEAEAEGEFAGYQPHGLAVKGDRLLVWAGPRRVCGGGADLNCGLGDPGSPDVLFTLDRESGAVTAATCAGQGNEPHHARLCGDRLFAGGLLSGNVTVFDVSDPDAPALEDTLTFTEHGLGAADDFMCHGDGVLITMMGSDTLTTPGGIVELGADLQVAGIYQPPKDAGLDAFNPHGFSMNEDAGWAASADFVEPASIAAGEDGTISPVVRNTVRLWNLPDWAYLGAVEVCAGPMEVAWSGDRALASCMVSGGLGWVWQDEDTDEWMWTECLDLDGAGALQAMPGGVRVDDAGTLWVALAAQGEVRKYDMSACDADNPPPDPDVYAAGPGAHAMAWTEDGSRGYVSDYFLQQAEQLGMLPGDSLVHWFDADTMEGGVLADFSVDATDDAIRNVTCQ